jgi:hypothetical protein
MLTALIVFLCIGVLWTICGMRKIWLQSLSNKEFQEHGYAYLLWNIPFQIVLNILFWFIAIPCAVWYNKLPFSKWVPLKEDEDESGQ